MKGKKKIYATYAPKTLCLRCGAERAEAKRLHYLDACSAHGGHYSRHLWNKEPVKCEVAFLNVTHQ